MGTSVVAAGGIVVIFVLGRLKCCQWDKMLRWGFLRTLGDCVRSDVMGEFSALRSFRRPSCRDVPSSLTLRRSTPHVVRFKN